MLKRVILFLIYMLPLLQFGQDFSNLWEGYFSYNIINDVVKGNNKIYAASENAIFSIDLDSNVLDEITTVHGLSGETISTIYYSETYELLVVGYENGLIEIVFDNDDNILTVVDILDKNTIQANDKEIKHINAVDQFIYLSTGFGISVFNLERLEFGDTYFIGDLGTQIEVNQTTIFEDYIYAACRDGGGLKKAPLSSPNLIDYRNWEQVSAGEFLAVQANADKLYAIQTNRRIYEVNNNVLTSLFLFTNTPVDLRSVENQLLVSTEDDIYMYNASFNLISQASVITDFDTEFTVATVAGDEIFIGSQDFGVLKTAVLSPTIFEEVHPDGPLLNSVFSIEADARGVWVTYGEYSLFYEPTLRARGVSRLNDDVWVNTPYADVFGARDLNTIVVNPSNRNQAFVSSFFHGLLEFNDDVPTVLYNQNNSGLESLSLSPTSTYVSIRVSGIAFDSNGLLWSITSLVNRAIKSFNPTNNQWNSYSFESIIDNPVYDNLGFGDLIIDNNNTKWISSFSKGVIGFNENNGSPLLKSIGEIDGNLPTKTVRALAIDNRNQLWIGTDIGLRVLYNTSNFFTDDDVAADEIIILENGIAKELLADQFISDIKVDGANNKWISTIGAGVFYLSSDGQETIYHFTADNSPLPSNNVNGISIDDTNSLIYFGTSNGLVSFKSGGSKSTEDLETVYAYPNPVRPNFDIVEKKVTIKNISENVNIKITDIEGNLVAEAQSRINLRYNNYNLEIDGGTVFWNGKNMANNVVSSGVYLIMISDLDTFETKVLKLMVVR
ncbi:two-component regulator propeller domain-containing protein [Algibacter miyuki]|uniref:Two-component regulator propeller domain-containing protein n=1 Tax=Algibacter miyuki TaxID=1306933 RepID=A0ABV5GW91_9FLAO|nr:two-component regulator propeller domain-containing protein [Algibacter miyuki]MDN3664795.1 ABC transporter substrate-binding protein [Algibacter miyuki]